MGDLEQRNRKRSRITNTQKLVLRSVAAVGVLSVGLLAPNVIGALNRMGILPRSRQKEYVSSSASLLTKKGLLKFHEGTYQLTSLGERVLKEWEFRDYQLNKPKKWDGKWRVVIFDIPSKKKKVRDHIRLILRQAGFEKLQNSVWVFPYECEDVIGLLKTSLGVGKNLLYLIVEEIENDKNLRSTFNLL